MKKCPDGSHHSPCQGLTLEALEHRLIGAALLLVEEHKELPNGRVQFAFRAVPYFALVPASEITVGHAPGDLLYRPHVRMPTQEVNKQVNDIVVFASRLL